MRKINLWLFATLAAGLFVVSCSKDDGPAEPDQPSQPDVPVISEIAYELSDDAMVVPENTTKSFFDVDTAQHTFCLPTGTPSNQVPQVGTCLVVNTPTSDLPDGLLAKVVNVQESSKGYVVTYEDAELGDAFKEINIPEQILPLGDIVEHVYNSRGQEIPFKKVSCTRATGQKTTKIQLPEMSWELPAGLELTPSMSADLTMKYSMQFSDGKPVYIGAKMDADIELGASLKLGAEKEFIDKHITLLTVLCGAIPVGPILITPTFDIHAIFKVNGEVSLEASVSYKRTAHAMFMYQEGQGMKFSFDIDPEAEDAWTFTFGPKLAGSVEYGLAIGPHITIYAKALGIGAMLDVTKKETISQQFNLVEFADGKWDFLKLEAANYSATMKCSLAGYYQVLGKPIKGFDGLDYEKEVDSRPVFPQFTIDEDNFMEMKKNVCTLKMQMTKKGLLYGKYRAEWTPVDDKNAKAVIEYFDFDDEKRALLEADQAADITCKGTLKDDVTYKLDVYYEYMGISLNVYHKEPETLKISMITVQGSIYGTSPDVAEGAPQEIQIGGAFSSKSTYTVTPKGKSAHIHGVYKADKYDLTLDCDIDDVNAIETKKAKLENIQFSRISDFDQYGAHTHAKMFIAVESLPMSSNHTPTWESSGGGMNITEFTSTTTTTPDDTAYPPTTTTYSLYPSSYNTMSITIYFK